MTIPHPARSPGLEEAVRIKKAGGHRIYSLGLGEPSFPTPAPIIEATARAMRDGHTHYSAVQGLPELRERIAQKLRADNGLDVDPTNVVVTPGAKNALFLAIKALVGPEDEVISIRPCYVSNEPQVGLAEPGATIRALDVRKDDFALDLPALESLITARTRLILLNTPNNPTGQMMTIRDLERLAEMVADAGCYVISDEVYEKLNFTETPHRSIGSLDAVKGQVITVNGFSKTFGMTGWRVGYVAAPANLVDRISYIQRHLNTHTCTFVQKGACAALDMGTGHLASYNRELRANADRLGSVAKKRGWRNFVAPHGGLFAFLDISRSGLDSETFAGQLLERHSVVVSPGSGFGAGWERYVRVSLAGPQDEFAEGIELLAGFVDEVAEVSIRR